MLNANEEFTAASEVDPETVAVAIGAADAPAPEVVDATAVRHKAVAGIKALGLRTLFTLGLRIFSSMLMARLLLPRDYGLYAVASWIAGIGLFLSDVGLAGALVHQQKPPTKDEQFTVFLMQQLFAGAIALVLIFAAPQLIVYAKLPAGAGLLLRVMAFGLFNSSLRTIPTMALERELRFGALARIDLVQSLVATAVTLILAWRGAGAWALVLGSLVSAFVALVVLWIASPWVPTGRFRWPIVTRLARFGLPFQLNGLVWTMFSGWVPFIVGRQLGVAAVGYANWASNLASTPMMLSAILNRVAFPSYARLQADPAALAKYLSASIRRLLVLMAIPIAAGILLCPWLIPVLFRTRWQPAVPLVQWFSFDTMMAVLTGIIASAQNATGRPVDRLIIAISAGLGRWGLGFIAVKTMGLAGVGPVSVTVGGAELLFSVWLLEKRSPETTGLLFEVIWRLFVLGTSLIVADMTGLAVAPYRASGAASAVGAFVVVAALWRLVTPGSLVPVEELRAAARMFRARAS
jgi:PST family polysaccharide transporter